MLIGVTNGMAFLSTGRCRNLLVVHVMIARCSSSSGGSVMFIGDITEGDSNMDMLIILDALIFVAGLFIGWAAGLSAGIDLCRLDPPWRKRRKVSSFSML